MGVNNLPRVRSEYTYVSIVDLGLGVQSGLGGNEQRRWRAVKERVRLTCFVHLVHVVRQLLHVYVLRTYNKQLTSCRMQADRRDAVFGRPHISNVK